MSEIFIAPYIGLKFYAWTFLRIDGENVLCKVVSIRNDEIVRYEALEGDFVGEVHINYFSRIVQGLPE